MAKFKVGDKVRCINSGSNGQGWGDCYGIHPMVGAILTISSIYDEAFQSTTTCGWFHDYDSFELVNNNPAMIMEIE